MDKLGAEDALAVVVIECLPGHEQLQELVAAGAERAYLRAVSYTHLDVYKRQVAPYSV